MHERMEELGSKTFDEDRSKSELAGNCSGARRLGMAKRSLEGRNDASPQTRVLGGPLFSTKGNQPFDGAGGDPREREVMNFVFARESTQGARRRRAQLSLKNTHQC